MSMLLGREIGPGARFAAPKKKSQSNAATTPVSPSDQSAAHVLLLTPVTGENKRKSIEILQSI